MVKMQNAGSLQFKSARGDGSTHSKPILLMALRCAILAGCITIPGKALWADEINFPVARTAWHERPMLERLSEAAAMLALAPPNAAESAAEFHERATVMRAASDLASRFAGMPSPPDAAAALPDNQKTSNSETRAVLEPNVSIGPQSSDAAPASTNGSAAGKKPSLDQIKPMGLGGPIDTAVDAKISTIAPAIANNLPIGLVPKSKAKSGSKASPPKIPRRVQTARVTLPAAIATSKAPALRDPGIWNRPLRDDPGHFVPSLSRCGPMTKECEAGQAMCGC